MVRLLHTANKWEMHTPLLRNGKSSVLREVCIWAYPVERNLWEKYCSYPVSPRYEEDYIASAAVIRLPASATFTSLAVMFCSGSVQCHSGADKFHPETDTLHLGTVTLHSGSASFHSGTVTFHSGTVSFHSGTVTLHSGTVTLHSGTVTCHSGIVTCHSGTVTFHSGPVTFHSGTVTCHSGADTCHCDINKFSSEADTWRCRILSTILTKTISISTRYNLSCNNYLSVIDKHINIMFSINNLNLF